MTFKLGMMIPDTFWENVESLCYLQYDAIKVPMAPLDIYFKKIVLIIQNSFL